MIGLVGCGLQGWRRARAARQNGDTLAIVADSDEQKAKLLSNEMGGATTGDWVDVVTKKNVDLVIVCVPNHLHAPISIAAMKEGKHVLCEKPIGKNPDEAELMVKAAQEAGVRLKCGFNLRHHAGVQQLRKWSDQKMLGKTIFIRARYGIGGRASYEKDWRANKEESGGGELLDQGIHIIDLVTWFMGGFKEVVGFTPTLFWNISPLEDNAFALFRTKAEQVASIHVSWTQWKNLFSFEIYGSDGYAQVEGLGGSYGTERAIRGRVDFTQPFLEEVIEYRGEDCSWLAEWKEFVSSIKQNREPLGNGYDGWQAVKLAFAVYESAQTGRIIGLT